MSNFEEGGSWNLPDIEWNNHPWVPQCYELSSQHRDCASRVKRNGVPWRAASHKPNISPVNAKGRLKWCKERRHWTADNWKRLIWGDESRYTMWRSGGRVWVWRMPGERYLPACVVPTVKFGGGDITVWGCISCNELGSLVILRGNLNTKGYKDILTRCILSRVEDQFGDDDCVYQHDSAPCHKARSVREWFMDNNVPEIDWPADSRDLHPIKHVWDELESRLHSKTQRPTTLTALARALQKQWAAIPQETFRHPVESFLTRIGAVIKAKGGPTRCLQFRVVVRILLIRQCTCICVVWH
jgi:hypothetical protein